MIFGGLFLGMLGAMHFGWKGFIVWGLCGVSAGIFGVWAGTPIVREPEPKKLRRVTEVMNSRQWSGVTTKVKSAISEPV
jgi:hypothetical protein